MNNYCYYCDFRTRINRRRRDVGNLPAQVVTLQTSILLTIIIILGVNVMPCVATEIYGNVISTATAVVPPHTTV